MSRLINKITFDEKSGIGKGNYQDLKNKISLTLDPTGEQVGSNLPSHRVMVTTRDGELIDCGACWSKKGQRGRVEGRVFYTMTLDDPSFDQALSLAAFPDDATGIFNLVWRRYREDEAA